MRYFDFLFVKKKAKVEERTKISFSISDPIHYSFFRTTSLRRYSNQIKLCVKKRKSYAFFPIKYNIRSLFFCCGLWNNILSMNKKTRNEWGKHVGFVGLFCGSSRRNLLIFFTVWVLVYFCFLFLGDGFVSK